jgi:hypothetical protein
MPVISDSLLTVIFPNGRRAVFAVQPQHVPRDDIPGSYAWPAQYGRQVAIEGPGGDWYTSPGEKITDARTLALIERAPVISDGRARDWTGAVLRYPMPGQTVPR